ncbi:MAG: four helix bundle protein [Desulfobacterota bacterium]|nr:four helix bundle protein [Thermodesulfobacteriota bacterium]
MRDFRDLVVWQKSHELFLSIVKDVGRFPRGVAGRVLADQVLRSSGSISANISEGFGRRRGREYVHYLMVARGSATETLNWLVKAYDLGWMDEETYRDREALVGEILKMLNKMVGLISKAHP